jgi:hypothetical protein
MGPQYLAAPTFVSVFVLQTLEFTTIELPPVCFNLARHSRSRSVKNDIVTETLAEIWVDGVPGTTEGTGHLSIRRIRQPLRGTVA